MAFSKLPFDSTLKSHRSSVMLFLASIALSICAYAYQRERTHSDLKVVVDGATTTMHLSSLASVDLLNVRTRVDAPLPPLHNGAHRLIIIASPGDCPACLSELPQWNALASEVATSQVDVALILVDASLSEAETIIDSYRPQYSVYLDAHQKLATSVGLPEKTPVAVLVDSSYTPRIAQGPTNDLKLQLDFNNLVREAARQYSSR